MRTVNLNEKKMMFGFNIGGKLEILFNTLIIISKWFLATAIMREKITVNHFT
jgi:hypothetical protein